MTGLIFNEDHALEAIRRTQANGHDWLYVNYPKPSGQMRKSTTGFLVHEGTAYPVKPLGRLANEIAGAPMNTNPITNIFRRHFQHLNFQLIDSPEELEDAATGQISVPNFEPEFSRFSEIVYRRFNDGPFTSFHVGAANGWEGYKPILRQRALAVLNPQAWTESQVGTGSILERAIGAIEVPGNDQTRNNLVSWEGRYGPGSAGHATLLAARTDPTRRRAFERWLMDAFRNGADPSELFERLRGLAGDGYPLAAYLFFLLDMERFAPIAPRTFDEAFRRLGIDLMTSGRCSWNNYLAFNDALEAVRAQLKSKAGLADTRHIDAHSFCWMLVRMEDEKPGGEKASGAVRYASARRRSIVGMAVNAASAAAQSGRETTTIRKDKEIHHHQRELETIIERLIEEQDGLCALTSLPLQWHGEAEDPAMLASLDRIDSGGHYSDGNLQVVCRFANKWKCATADGEFRRLLEAVRAWPRSNDD